MSRVVVDVLRIRISIGPLHFESKLLVLACVNSELVTDVKLLEDILHHEIEGIPLGDIVQIKGAKIIAINHGLIMNDISGYR